MSMSKDESLAAKILTTFPLFMHTLFHDFQPPSGALDLSKTQMKVLMVVYIESAPYMTGVCRHMNMEKGSLTPVIDRLAQANLVERGRSPADRRRVNLRLTEVGLSLVEAALHRAHRHILEKLKTLPEEDVERFKSALSVLHEITMKL
jgi:DNA-binding MarR family transcriptional regulator